MGGDEFLIILENTDLIEAYRRIDLLRQTIASSLHPFEECILQVSISVGISEWCEGERVEDTLKRADQALYSSKHRGRNKVSIAPSFHRKKINHKNDH